MPETQSEWYVVHTYSGYENKVKANLEKTVENRSMQEYVQEIRVPVEEVIEMKNGKRHTTQRKIYPGYVMVKMVMTDESWYVVRNTRGVTGFVGPGSKPIPLTPEEVANMGVDGVVRQAPRIDMAVGDTIRVTSGPLESFTGYVTEVDNERQKLRVTVSLFGRDTPVDLDYAQVQRI